MHGDMKLTTKQHKSVMNPKPLSTTYAFKVKLSAVKTFMYVLSNLKF